MGQIIDEGLEQVITPTTTAGTTKGEWILVETGKRFRVICAVENLSGTTPTLDWSIEHKDNPADTDEAVTELFAATDFTQVTAGPFPNTQMKYVGIGNDSIVNKKYIRPVWTLGGTTPVATVNVKVEYV